MRQKPGVEPEAEAVARGAEHVAPYGLMPPAPTLKTRAVALAKRVLRRLGRPVLGPLRRALLGPVQAMIVDLHVKHDAALVKQDYILAKHDATLLKQDHILAKQDAALRSLHRLDLVADGFAQMEKLVAQQAELDHRLAALRARIDDIGVKVRGPIDLDAQTRAIRTADGYAAVPSADTTLTTMLIDADIGGLEPGTRTVLRRLLQPGATFVDVGAHIGLLTLVAARVVGVAGRVHAFEASPDTFALLERTVAMNHFAPPVVARSVAVGAVAERRTFHVRNVMGHSSLYDFADSDEGWTTKDVAVEVRPLDELIAPGARVDVVKIDVEGAELDVLAGMKRILATNPEIVLITEFGPSHLARTGVTPQAWFGAFAAQGLEALAIDEETGACRPVGPADVAEVASVNIVFLAPFSRASEILAEVAR